MPCDERRDERRNARRDERLRNTLMELAVRAESWPIRGHFTIARGARTSAEVVVAELSAGGVTGRGECVPYARYDETVPGVMAAIEAAPLSATTRPQDLQQLMPAGAARAALDCALWDLWAKSAGQPVWKLAGLPEPKAVTTAFTLSLGSPESMKEKAHEAAAYPLLKVKLGCGTASGDAARIRAVRAGAPSSALIIDANEAWSMDDLVTLAPLLRDLDVRLVEQPLPAGDDVALAQFQSPVPLCADESCHDRQSLPALIGRYDMINIKLNKTGGLTEAIALMQAARAAGLQVMVGCMLGTSLAMAPAALIAASADYVDLDGPLLLARDRAPGMIYENGLMLPPPPKLWG